MDTLRRGPVPGDARAAFVDALEAAGRRTPVAWVGLDLAGTVPMFEPATPPPPTSGSPCVLGLAVFDGGGRRATPLAFVHPHGAWIEWLAGR